MVDRLLIRGLALAAALAACGGSGGSVALVLDIPNSMLDPMRYSNVEVTLHHADGNDSVLDVGVSGEKFDLGSIDVEKDVMIEATLRTASGGAVGYGRGAGPADLKAGAKIVIPVRRPIVYFAGLVSEDVDGDPSTNDIHWTRAKPTFSDLSSGTTLDGSAVLGETAVMMASAGPNLYIFDQQPMDPTGALMGAPTIKSVSTGDHTIGAALAATVTGGVLDAAGSDDGKLLLVGTTTQLFVINTDSGVAKAVADGSFSRVAIVSAADGVLSAVAVKDRSDVGACSAQLVWIASSGDEISPVVTLGTSGYTDVAGDVGRAFYVDTCKGGELGEATANGTQMLRTGLGKPTALAVSNGSAWIGIEKIGSANMPVGIALISASLKGTEMPNVLFDEPVTQVLEATDFPGVQRQLPGISASFMHLEVGAGGDYVATTVASKFSGEAIIDANFPKMDIESQELRVIDTATGAPVQRYRSWCDGVLTLTLGDIDRWYCATAPGQLAAATLSLEHRLNSMTFQFGKK